MAIASIAGRPAGAHGDMNLLLILAAFKRL